MDEKKDRNLVQESNNESAGKILLDSEDNSSSSSVQSRGNWGRQLDYMLTMVGYAVGLGNIWRFPYLTLRNGGGAFLIPYFTALILCGIPLFYLEVAIGQYSGQSPTGVWNVCPLFKGIGWAMGLVSGICCTYYNVVISWVLFYLFKSFTSRLPWGDCMNSWNTLLCDTKSTEAVYDARPANLTDGNNSSFYVKEHNSTAAAAQTEAELRKALNLGENGTIPWRSSAEEFFEFIVTQKGSGIADLGGIQWEQALCLLLAWAVVFLCLSRGVKSLGKVVYFTATVPYLLLTVLLIRGVTLPGAMDGIKFYLIPQWEKLLEPSVWAEACTQIFYSLGPAWGGLITMASYNKFHNNCERDAILIPLVNCGTSFYGGFVIFSVIGFMAKEAGVPISEAIDQGPGLAFVAYPEAIAKLPFSPVWAIIFFLMMFNIGLGTQFGMFEGLVSCVVDQFPRTLMKYKLLVNLSLCILLYLCGLAFISQAGFYIFTLIDWYMSVITLMLVSALECVILCWVYGHEKLSRDIEMMIGHRPALWWKMCWCGISPSILVVMLIFNLSVMKTPNSETYTYPPWAIVVGWSVAIFSSIPIPVFAVSALLQEEGTLKERFFKALRPSPEWGPSKTYRMNKSPEEVLAVMNSQEGSV